MVRHWFYGISAAIFAFVGLIWWFWPPVLWSLVVLAPLFALGLRDALQNRHTVLKNFPIIGHGRYMVEGVRPELQQYLIESNLDAFPVEREFRSLVYQRAKNELETRPFGTQRDVYQIGYEWASHSLAPVEELDEEPRVMFGGDDCTQPYSASHLNVSAMSFGAISSHAILALNGGAKKGGFAHNTGEGGVSKYHLQPGGDLIWQVGTGYFGCRTKNGGFDPERFREAAGRETIRMIELKLSQGAKPGHGGILPAAKVTPEIAEARGLPEYEAALSPPWHSAFTTPVEMIEFAAHAWPRRAGIRTQRTDRGRPARQGTGDLLREGAVVVPHDPGLRAWRRYLQLGARHDVRIGVHPGAQMQQQHLPDRYHDPEPGADQGAARAEQDRASAPISPRDHPRPFGDARGNGAGGAGRRACRSCVQARR